MRKIYLLSLLGSLLLSACGSNSIVGTYSFRMGKTEDTHVGLTINLKDNDYKELISGNQYKEFEITLDIPSGEDDVGILSLLGLDALIGYYFQDKTISSSFGDRLCLGTTIFNELLFELTDEESIDIPPEFIEKILVAYINSSELTIQVPVSLKDLQLQLAWYGYFLDLDASDSDSIFKTLDQTLLPGETGNKRIGTLPVVDEDKNINQVTEMNQIFAFDFARTFLYINGEKNAAFVKENVSGVDEYSLKTKTGQILQGEITGSVKCLRYDAEQSDIIYDVDTPVKILIDEYGYISSITRIDNNNEVDFYEFYQNPFVFRKFHVIQIGLKRE